MPDLGANLQPNAGTDTKGDEDLTQFTVFMNEKSTQQIYSRSPPPDLDISRNTTPSWKVFNHFGDWK